MRQYALALPLALLLAMSSVAVDAGASTPTASTTHTTFGWLVSGTGSTQAVGEAQHLGDLNGYSLNAAITGIKSTPDGNGYWMVAADGGIFAFGNARFHGSMGGQPLAAPVVAIATTATGGGYWMVAADGGIFAFGDARFFGSLGGNRLSSPIVSIAATDSDNGYWMVAADGEVFEFGDAEHHGSMGSAELHSPVTSIAGNTGNTGYWLLGSDGGVFSFGSAAYLGSAAALNIDAVDIAPTASGDGYQIAIADGRIIGFGAALSNTLQLGAGRVVAAAIAPVPAPPMPPQKAGEPSRSTEPPPPDVGSGSIPDPMPTATTPTTVAPRPKTLTAEERAYSALGIYRGGAGPSNLLAHEKFMGRKANYWLAWFGDDFQSTLTAVRSEASRANSKFLNGNRTVIMSIVLTELTGRNRSEDANRLLTDAKNGANDWFWKDLGTILAKNNLTGFFPDGRPKVILRIGWEHNGRWYPWSSRAGRSDLYRAAYRRAVKKLESRAGNVVTSWGSSAVQNSEADLLASYPGDDVVDIIEVDIYDSYTAYLPNPLGTQHNIAQRENSWTRRFEGKSDQLAGVRFFAEFSRKHNKGFGIGEFAVTQQVKDGVEVGGGDNAGFIKHIFEFAGAQENLVYVNYFEKDRTRASHRLNSHNFPLAKAKFLKLFGNR